MPVSDGWKNLKPTTKRSKEEARQNSRKGGIKSGEVRRANRDMRNEMRAVLDMLLPAPGKSKNYDRVRAALRALGIPDDEITMRRAILVNAVQMALTPKGVQWAKLAAELSGEMPEKKMSVEAEVTPRAQIHILVPDNGRDGIGERRS